MNEQEQRGGGKGRGPHWKHTSRRSRSAGRMARRRAKYPPPIPEFGKCKRCRVAFIPEWMECLSIFSTCCPNCQVLNIAEALRIPELAALFAPKGEA